MDGPKEKPAQAAPAAAGGGARMIIIAVASSLISVIAALAVFYFAFMPKLSGPAQGEEAVEAAGEEGGEHGEGPAPNLTVEFDDITVTCIMPSPDMSASILMFQIALDCANANAVTLIESNKARFAAKIREVHSYKKRLELDNPQLEQDILKSVVQESNALLQEITGKPAEKTRVKEAYHVKFFIQDL